MCFTAKKRPREEKRMPTGKYHVWQIDNHGAKKRKVGADGMTKAEAQSAIWSYKGQNPNQRFAAFPERP
jgi:hypothetical protein